MRGVGFFSECIDDEHVETLEEWPARFGDFADVCAISDITDPESKDRQTAMMQPDWLDGRSEQRE
tara:strand:- start:671 stop:865 length:195 start_codon:yes stop_codon:yes gene_type:complete